MIKWVAGVIGIAAVAVIRLVYLCRTRSGILPHLTDVLCMVCCFHLAVMEWKRQIRICKDERMNIFYTSDRNIWRNWLAEHFKTDNEIWFVFPMKESGDPSLSYNDAVEEALCFGWIDSTIKHIDPTHRAQRFTPRKKGSPYSRPNIERLIWLDEKGMLHPSIRDSVLPSIREPYAFPNDILDFLKEDAVAWKNYEKFPEPYKRIRIAYIDAARKRPVEFKKRLESFRKKTHDGKMVAGYGGIDKYYK